VRNILGEGAAWIPGKGIFGKRPAPFVIAASVVGSHDAVRARLANCEGRQPARSHLRHIRLTIEATPKHSGRHAFSNAVAGSRSLVPGAFGETSELLR